MLAMSFAPGADGMYFTLIMSGMAPFASEKFVFPLKIVNCAALGPDGVATLPTNVVFFSVFEILNDRVGIEPAETSPKSR